MLSRIHLRGWIGAWAPLLLAASSLGCSSAGAAPEADQIALGATLRVEVSSSPNPPTQGTNSIELVVTSQADGTPEDGLTVSMVPWMPADDHGTSLTPTVTPEGGGKYLVTGVDFFMAGHWVLNTSFSGPVTDHVAPAYDVP